MTNERALAAERSHRNRFSGTHAGIIRDPIRIDEEGVAGELAFALEFGIDSANVTAEKPVPYNFMLADGTHVDVRTSRAAGYLMVPPSKLAEESRAKAIDVFVLARYDDVTGKARLIGWANRIDMLAAPPYKMSQLEHATITHNIPARSLRPISDLLRRHRAAVQPTLF